MNFKTFITKKILKENVPVTGDFDTWSRTLRAGVGARTDDTYLFKTIADALNTTVQGAVDVVSRKLFDKLFPNNTPNPAVDEGNYRQAIFNALTEVVNEINRERNVNITNAKAIKTYTSRIISSLGSVTADFSRKPQATIRQAINRANDEVVVAPRQKPVLSDIDKLKNKLVANGYGEGVTLTDEQKCEMFGIKNPANIEQKELYNFYKKYLKYLRYQTLTHKTTSKRVNNYLRNIIPNKPFELQRGIAQRNYLGFSIEELDNSPTLEFDYAFGATTSLISSSGKKFIDTLVRNFNVTPVKICKKFVSDNQSVQAFTYVLLLTRHRHTIAYCELQKVESSSTRGRALIGPPGTDGTRSDGYQISISNFLSSLETQNYWYVRYVTQFRL